MAADMAVQGLGAHSRFFDHLVDLVPAKYYLGTDETVRRATGLLLLVNRQRRLPIVRLDASLASIPRDFRPPHAAAMAPHPFPCPRCCR